MIIFKQECCTILLARLSSCTLTLCESSSFSCIWMITPTYTITHISCSCSYWPQSHQIPVLRPVANPARPLLAASFQRRRKPQPHPARLQRCRPSGPDARTLHRRQNGCQALRIGHYKPGRAEVPPERAGAEAASLSSAVGLNKTYVEDWEKRITREEIARIEWIVAHETAEVVAVRWRLRCCMQAGFFWCFIPQ